MKNETKKKQVDFWIKTTWLSISRMYNSFASEYDTTYAAGLALLYIDVEKGTPATKIAPQMGMESRSLTRILKSLEKRGMITRAPDPKDGRRVIIRLTPEGVRYRDFSKETVLGFNDYIRQIVPQEKLDCFFEVMDKIQEATEEYTQQSVTQELERSA